MKKLFFSLFVLSALMLTTSCSSDDDGGTTTNASVQGSWKLTSLLTQTALDIDNNGTASNDLLIESNCYLNETISFNAAGVGSVNTNSYLEVTIDSQTDEYSIDCVIEAESFPMTYTVSGNTVTIDDNDLIVTATITGNTMTFVIPDGYVIEDENFTVTVEEDLTFTYTKQ